MRAYKFRSAKSLKFALDIIQEKRLFCADWRSLNDPMEGIFAYSTHGKDTKAERLVKGIGEAKSRYKVCSLAADFQSHLMWAHYADGFSGLAIEVDLPDDDPRVRSVEYRGVFAFLNMDQVVDEDDAARRILFSKYQEWSYEKEIRIITPDEYYFLSQPVRRIIVGPRMDKTTFKKLYLVCGRENIEFCKVGIGDEGIDPDRVWPDDPRLK